ERKGDDICFQAVDDRTRLFTRAAMRHPDCYVVAGPLLPMCSEERIELLIELASWIVTDVEKRDFGRRCRFAEPEGQHQDCGSKQECEAGSGLETSVSGHRFSPVGSG